MKDRFDLEDEIQQMGNVVEDIERLRWYICDRNPSEDEVDNYLLGLSQMYQAQFDKLYDTFEKSHGLYQPEDL